MKFYTKAYSIRKPNALEEQFCKFNYSMEIRGSADIREQIKELPFHSVDSKFVHTLIPLLN